MQGTPRRPSGHQVEEKTPTLREALRRWLSSVLGCKQDVGELRRLAGGASQEVWAFTCSGRPLVLRRGVGGSIYDYGLDQEGEFRLLQAAYRSGIAVPETIAFTDDLLGRPAFVMERIEGESIGRRLVSAGRYAAVRSRLTGQLAKNLAGVHRLHLDVLPFLARPTDPKRIPDTEVGRLQGWLDSVGESHPALELGLHWLLRHPPSVDEPCLVHGDFRTGNFMVTPEAGLTGLLDWEHAHVGDPAEDLGWFCVRAWRFGADALEAGGLADREVFLTGYEEHADRPVDRSAVRWWELYGNVRWAVGTLLQARRHLNGLERSIELASLGRLCPEMELEVLRLLDEVEP